MKPRAVIIRLHRPSGDHAGDNPTHLVDQGTQSPCILLDVHFVYFIIVFWLYSSTIIKLLCIYIAVLRSRGNFPATGLLLFHLFRQK